MPESHLSRSFGRAARRHWDLLEDGIFLNHGSWGACPRIVRLAQDRVRLQMEEQPDKFFREAIMPVSDHTLLRQSVAEMSGFIGAPQEAVAFVENATSGIQAALQSIPLGPGDEILITDHQYRSVRLAVEARCRETGAVVQVARIPLPATSEEILRRICESVTPRVRLAIIDHITSSAALVFPIAPIVAALHKMGVLVLVDGAQALGQIPIDVCEMGADWYVANAHKWLYAPKGSALLYAAKSVAADTRPIIISHFAEAGFPRSFDYIGARDYSAWLAMPVALAFFRDLGPESLGQYMREIVSLARELLVPLGATPAGSDDTSAAMVAFVLPQRRPATDLDATLMRRALWERHRIQVKCDTLFGRLMMRISAQAYVESDDIARLREALVQDGWPGR